MTQMPPFATVSDSTWTALTVLLRRSVLRHARMLGGKDRIVLEQESDDLVQDVLFQKLGRPAWVEFVRRCARSLEAHHLPSRLRGDLRSFIFRRLKTLRKMDPLSTSQYSPLDRHPSVAQRNNPSEDAVGNDYPNADAMLQKRLVRRRLQKVQQIVCLRLEGLTIETIASRVGLCEKTVRTRLKSVQELCRQHRGLCG